LSRIAPTFRQLADAGRKALIPFFTAGDPDPASTVPLMHALVAGGADIVELGIPFSDPMADGPVIQRSSERALKHGVSLLQVLEMARRFRDGDQRTPLVLMGYANPIERLGFVRFAEEARLAGVDGVLVVDYPPEECVALVAALRANDIDTIFLLSPTSTDARVSAVGALASGYVYYVSLRGVTGASNIDTSEVAAQVARIRQHVAVPVGVGFGIRDAETACAVSQIADAVVVGSRIVLEIEAAEAGEAAPRVQALMREFRSAMDRGAS
jgi:tryptophan synthase alpha chain